jgi:hypothetical protein
VIEFLRVHLTSQHLGWFGAGLSAAALGVTAYQLLFATAPLGPLPPPVLAQPPPAAFASRTPFPTRTPYPSRTPYPTRTPTATPYTADLLGTAVAGDPDRIVAAVATLAARTSDAVASLQATPRSR